MVRDAALPAGKHRWALLRAREQHLCGDVLGEEPELVFPQHPAPARVRVGRRARASSSPEACPAQGKPSQGHGAGACCTPAWWNSCKFLTSQVYQDSE